MNCPKCRKLCSTYCNDGGSSVCDKCAIVFHYCLKGVKYDSPVPSMCPECKICNQIHRDMCNIITYFSQNH